MLSHVNRRSFLYNGILFAGTWLFPKPPYDKTLETFHWFIQIDTDNFWLVDDPVKWCLENARHPTLVRASQELLNLTHKDNERVIHLSRGERP